MKRPHIWSIDEIHALPEFGADYGWFYGLIRFGGRLYIGEIFPGFGFTTLYWRDIASLRTIVRDVFHYRPKEND